MQQLSREELIKINNSPKSKDFEYYYITPMFPYPSGTGLHVGHWYNYALVDSYCRYKKYIGENVFQPFGYDAFGLPAENYARLVNGDPKEITYQNIDNFRKQISSMNTNYEELLITSDKEYQRYTQWLFTKLKDNGLAYKKEGEVDHCSNCETTLAREQVKDGKCERCGTLAEKKTLNQWYFKITDYKDRLIQGLDNLDYPKGTIKAQRNWLENQHDWCVSRQRVWGCPIPIEGETDTMDTFVDSSFYTIIYPILKGLKPKPVDVYVGGSEHACMHLIYARFITMFLYDIGVIDFEEPFTKVVHQGMIINKGEKMSKSKGNTVSLDDYDSNVIRFYLMFIGHYFDGGDWDDSKIKGITRFINNWKQWCSADNSGEDDIDYELFEKEVLDYTEAFKFNKVVSSFMILLKQNKNKKLKSTTVVKLNNLLRIFMPTL